MPSRRVNVDQEIEPLNRSVRYKYNNCLVETVWDFDMLMGYQKKPTKGARLPVTPALGGHPKGGGQKELCRYGISNVET